MFVRAPMVGAVKSRLVASIGAIAAQRVYCRITESVLRPLVADPRWRTWLSVTPDGFARRGRFWPAHVPRQAQGTGDLGQRMSRALASFPRRPVVVIGSDIPGIGRDHIARAFEALRHADYVFGPAADGGYWLVGARPGVPVDRLFRNVRWSGPHALADTLDNVRSPRKVGLLEELEDVDDVAAFERWRERED